MICPYCGANMPDEMKFCTSCGGNLPEAQPQQTSQPGFGQPQAYTPQQPQPLPQQPSAPQPINQTFDQGNQQSFSPMQTSGRPQASGGRRIIVAVIACIIAFGVARAIGSALGGAMGSSGSSGITSGTSDAPAVSSDISDDYVDENGNITCLALMELDGDEVADLLEDEGYSWSSGSSCYLRQSDMAAVAAMDEDDNLLGESEFGRLSAGCAGESTVYINSVAGYSSGKAALRGAAGGEIVDSIVNGDDAAAVIEDSSGNYFFVTVSDHGDGTYDIVIWNEDSVESGEFEENFDVEGDSIAEVWEAISGESI